MFDYENIGDSGAFQGPDGQHMLGATHAPSHVNLELHRVGREHTRATTSVHH